MSSPKALTEAELTDTHDRYSRRLRVAELKDILRAVGARLSGTKDELIARLTEQQQRWIDTSDQPNLIAFRYLVLSRCDGQVSLPRISEVVRHIIAGTMDLSILRQHPPSETPQPQPIRGSKTTHTVATSVPLPGHSLYFTKSPFYQLVQTVSGSPQMCRPSVGRNATEMYVTFNASEMELFSRIHTQGIRLYLLSGVENELHAESPVEWPHPAEIYVNGNLVNPAQYKGIKGAVGTAKPVDVSSLMSRAPARNKIHINYCKTTETYLLYLCFVEVVPIARLLERIVAHPAISRQATIDAIRANGDDDIEVGTSSVSLRDPLSFVRMKYPVKSTQCSHPQCFDAEVYLQSQLQLPSWKCPHCNRQVTLESLALSEYFVDIMKVVDDRTESVTVNADGTWVADAVDDSDDDSGSDGETAPKRPPPKVTEVVCLDSDDDEPMEGGVIQFPQAASENNSANVNNENNRASENRNLTNEMRNSVSEIRNSANENRGSNSAIEHQRSNPANPSNSSASPSTNPLNPVATQPFAQSPAHSPPLHTHPTQVANPPQPLTQTHRAQAPSSHASTHHPRPHLPHISTGFPQGLPNPQFPLAPLPDGMMRSPPVPGSPYLLTPGATNPPLAGMNGMHRPDTQSPMAPHSHTLPSIFHNRGSPPVPGSTQQVKSQSGQSGQSSPNQVSQQAPGNHSANSGNQSVNQGNQQANPGNQPQVNPHHVNQPNQLHHSHQPNQPHQPQTTSPSQSHPPIQSHPPKQPAQAPHHRHVARKPADVFIRRPRPPAPSGTSHAGEQASPTTSPVVAPPPAPQPPNGQANGRAPPPGDADVSMRDESDDDVPLARRPSNHRAASSASPVANASSNVPSPSMANKPPTAAAFPSSGSKAGVSQQPVAQAQAPPTQAPPAQAQPAQAQPAQAQPSQPSAAPPGPPGATSASTVPKTTPEVDRLKVAYSEQQRASKEKQRDYHHALESFQRRLQRVLREDTPEHQHAAEEAINAVRRLQSELASANLDALEKRFAWITAALELRPETTEVLGQRAKIHSDRARQLTECYNRANREKAYFYLPRNADFSMSYWRDMLDNVTQMLKYLNSRKKSTGHSAGNSPVTGHSKSPTMGHASSPQLGQATNPGQASNPAQAKAANRPSTQMTAAASGGGGGAGTNTKISGGASGVAGGGASGPVTGSSNASASGPSTENTRPNGPKSTAQATSGTAPVRPASPKRPSATDVGSNKRQRYTSILGIEVGPDTIETLPSPRSATESPAFASPSGMARLSLHEPAQKSSVEVIDLTDD
ncbi:hypothetical protein DICA1_B07448 [Diutina catenulata]